MLSELDSGLEYLSIIAEFRGMRHQRNTVERNRLLKGSEDIVMREMVQMDFMQTRTIFPFDKFVCTTNDKVENRDVIQCWLSDLSGTPLSKYNLTNENTSGGRSTYGGLFIDDEEERLMIQDGRTFYYFNIDNETQMFSCRLDLPWDLKKYCSCLLPETKFLVGTRDQVVKVDSINKKMKYRTVKNFGTMVYSKEHKSVIYGDERGKVFRMMNEDCIDILRFPRPHQNICTLNNLLTYENTIIYQYSSKDRNFINFHDMRKPSVRMFSLNDQLLTPVTNIRKFGFNEITVINRCCDFRNVEYDGEQCFFFHQKAYSFGLSHSFNYYWTGYGTFPYVQIYMSRNYMVSYSTGKVKFSEACDNTRFIENVDCYSTKFREKILQDQQRNDRIERKKYCLDSVEFSVVVENKCLAKISKMWFM